MSLVVANVEPLRPVIDGWHEVEGASALGLGNPCRVFEHKTLHFVVMSTVEIGIDADGNDTLPEYRLTMTRYGAHTEDVRRCARVETQMILKQFGFEDAVEDALPPGEIVRCFSRRCAP